ncbi:hypothetical protein AGMMS50230_03300 [Spirochaetia bacterium]|nr:hypothetical protein AGMMS50230_03300 [Spirochaetia bacterium]
MKKLVILLVLCAVLAGGLFAFDPMAYSLPVKSGNILVDAGLGYQFGITSGYKMSIPPIFVSAEYALPKIPLSVGVLAAFSRYKYDFPGYSFSYNITYFTIGARGNWHWNLPVENLDLYTGIFLGYEVASAKISDDRYSWANFSADNKLRIGGQVGAHYYFTKNIGAMLEIGYPFLKAGVALKF